jgi:hypothetical protein
MRKPLRLANQPRPCHAKRRVASADFLLDGHCVSFKSPHVGNIDSLCLYSKEDEHEAAQ